MQICQAGSRGARACAISYGSDPPLRLTNGCSPLAEIYRSSFALCSRATMLNVMASECSLSCYPAEQWGFSARPVGGFPRIRIDMITRDHCYVDHGHVLQSP
jgi:hypothetical protein